MKKSLAYLKGILTRSVISFKEKERKKMKFYWRRFFFILCSVCVMLEKLSVVNKSTTKMSGERERGRGREREREGERGREREGEEGEGEREGGRGRTRGRERERRERENQRRLKKTDTRLDR